MTAAVIAITGFSTVNGDKHSTNEDKVMRTTLSALALTASLVVSPLAIAEWTYSHDSFVNKWVVSDGDQSIKYNKEKSARKAAKALNKAEKKANKGRGDGVWDDGSGHCDNPFYNC